MKVIDHGVWTIYEPDLKDPKLPDGLKIFKDLPPALFSKNAKGEDWYVYRQKVKDDTTKILLWPSTNQVFGANQDTSIIFPANFRLIEIDKKFNYEKDLMLRYYDEKTKTFSERQ